MMHHGLLIIYTVYVCTWLLLSSAVTGSAHGGMQHTASVISSNLQ